MNLYRRYRPSNLDEVIGQDLNVKIIKSFITNDQVPQSMIITGKHGVGKTSIARIISKSVNCLNRDDYNPCNNCNTCINIDNGSSMDVLELDGASNNGVDEIRNLKEMSNYNPSSLTKKVYIIDEFHMLSTAAFNALLKILEEPPKNVMFILATTELSKIPSTILSRCIVLSLVDIARNPMRDFVKEILKKEKIDFEEKSIDILVDNSDGSMRDALSMLEKVIIFNKSVTVDNLSETLGIANTNFISEAVRHFENGRFDDFVKSVTNYCDSNNLDVSKFINSFLEEILSRSILSNTDFYKNFDISNFAKESYELSKTTLTNNLMLKVFFLKIKNALSSSKVNSLIKSDFQTDNSLQENSKENDNINETFEIDEISLDDNDSEENKGNTIEEKELDIKEDNSDRNIEATSEVKSDEEYLAEASEKMKDEIDYNIESSGDEKETFDEILDKEIKLDKELEEGTISDTLNANANETDFENELEANKSSSDIDDDLEKDSLSETSEMSTKEINIKGKSEIDNINTDEIQKVYEKPKSNFLYEYEQIAKLAIDNDLNKLKYIKQNWSNIDVKIPRSSLYNGYRYLTSETTPLSVSSNNVILVKFKNEEIYEKILEDSFKKSMDNLLEESFEEKYKIYPVKKSDVKSINNDFASKKTIFEKTPLPQVPPTIDDFEEVEAISSTERDKKYIRELFE
ncbi:MAG: DNA polymerase III subunit gamma/tau [Mycoplasmataceae bacterium]|nr:DNA polymerase III subunit gamma/tau [Mycoplasmataceae bacterium]